MADDLRARYAQSFAEVRHMLRLEYGRFVFMPVLSPDRRVSEALARDLEADGYLAHFLAPEGDAWRALAGDLLSLPPEPGRVTVVHGAVPATPAQVEGLWILNQKRDLFAIDHQNPLLWCGDHDFHDTCQGAMPDMWSIRDLHVELVADSALIEREEAGDAGSQEVYWANLPASEAPREVQGGPVHSARLLLRDARREARQGAWFEARELLERGLARADGLEEAESAILLARVELERGDLDACAAHLERAGKSLRVRGASGSLLAGEWHRAAAALARRRGRPGQARRQLEAARTIFAEERAPHELAATWLELGGLLREKSPDAAGDALRAALDIAQRAGFLTLEAASLDGLAALARAADRFATAAAADELAAACRAWTPAEPAPLDLDPVRRRRLVQRLADRVAEPWRARALLLRAGLEPRAEERGGKPLERWSRAFRQAEREGRLGALVARAEEDVG